MPDVNVHILAPLGSLHKVLQDHSIGTDGCSVGVGMVAIMADGSKWCANFDGGLQDGAEKLAGIQAATYSMLTNALQQQPLRLVAATTAELTGATLAIWKGMQQFFAAAEKHARTGIFARENGTIGMLAASDRLLGLRAHQNFHATISLPVNHSTPTLIGMVREAVHNARGFDTDSTLTQSDARKFVRQGYSFCLRYLSLHAKTGRHDLTFGEAQDILNGGLALMPVQHVPYVQHRLNNGWMPDARLGAERGSLAAIHAQRIGVPLQTNIWLDLEGISTLATAEEVIAYCTSWYDAVSIYQYSPGVYVGYDCGLDGRQLHDLPFRHYWQSSSAVPPIPGRGYQMVQTDANVTANGLKIDHDTIRADHYGGLPQWWTKAG